MGRKRKRRKRFERMQLETRSTQPLTLQAYAALITKKPSELTKRERRQLKYSSYSEVELLDYFCGRSWMTSAEDFVEAASSGLYPDLLGDAPESAPESAPDIELQVPSADSDSRVRDEFSEANKRGYIGGTNHGPLHRRKRDHQ